MTTQISGADTAIAGFADVFDTIAGNAAHFDRDRVLPHKEIALLAGRGFGALRVPREFGGAGLSVTEFTDVLLELARADSNFVQLLRSHFLYVEALLLAPRSDARDEWLRTIGSGAVLGGAATERGAANSDRFATTVTVTDSGERVLNGTKFYSTGSIFADYVATIAEGAEGLEHIVVPRDVPGLTLVDDWDGFGQRLTGSGTTIFENVVVDTKFGFPEGAGLGSYATSFAQLFHLVGLAGIAARAHEEVLDYVRSRERYFAQRAVLPRNDSAVQAIVGELSSTAYLSRTLVRQNAAELQVLADATLDGRPLSELEDSVELQVYRAQSVLVPAVLTAVTRLFDVGGASALASAKNWDRFWRNARTLSSHNPVDFRRISIGDFELNGVSPFRAWFSGVDLTSRVHEAGAL